MRDQGINAGIILKLSKKRSVMDETKLNRCRAADFSFPKMVN